jgi:hypothetical protein
MPDFSNNRGNARRSSSTVYVCILLSFATLPCGGGTSSGGAADSLRRSALKDSLVRVLDENRRRYDHTADSGGREPFSIPACRLFDADISAPSEGMSTASLCVPVSFGLSNRFNRYLLYGNTAPVSKIFTDGDLLFTSFDPTRGTDDVFTTEVSSVSMLPANAVRYSPVQGAAVPEGLFYWENGVFNENVLTIRFTRPFSERLSMNAFSNYRHFNAKNFSHSGNNVYSFYQSLTPDTSTIVNRGYNPLTNEYTGGVRLQWNGAGGAQTHLGARYTDCVNELTLDRPVTSPSALVRSRLNQYRTALNLGSAGNRLGPARVDFEAKLESNALVRVLPVTGTMTRNDGSDNGLSCALRAGFPLTEAVSGSFVYRLQQTVRHPFDRREPSTALEQAPGLFLDVHRDLGRLQASAAVSAEERLYRLDNTFGTAPSWSAAVSAGYGDQTARAYAMQSALPGDIPYDSAMGLAAPLLDRYRVVGGEVSLRRRSAAIVLGCQSIEGVEPVTVRHAWPEGAVPYAQPRLVLIAAPELGPWHGLSIMSRTLISDSRPVLKSQTVLSCAAHLAETREYIDVRLGFDYWSARDSIAFAGLYEWNRPVCNASLELAVHVISFRFFGKIDNLLNRKYAYVPGYFSPGVTFRWGFNWFLQR